MKIKIILSVLILMCISLFTVPDTGAVVVPPLPKLFIPAPPPLVVIPGTYAYVVPDIEVDVIFHSGFWYRPFSGSWYRSGHYNGPWVIIAPPLIPAPILKLPPNVHVLRPGFVRIPHGHVIKNWNAWERDKYWEKRSWKPEWREVPKPGKGRGPKWKN